MLIKTQKPIYARNLITRGLCIISCLALAEVKTIHHQPHHLHL